MKLICACLFFIIITTTEIIWGGQQIETVVFPSEDEIVEALSLGEISIEQFYLLTELISNRVMPSSFLLDEIPRSLLQIDTTIDYQSEYFVLPKNKLSPDVTIQNRYASYLDEHSSTRIQLSLLYEKSNFEFNLILKREYSGRERFIRRYFSYAPVDNSYNVIVGNFTKRFGLGGVIGYRGKLLSYSDEFDNESLLFPDYGGFNGLYLQKNFGDNRFETVLSFNRDINFSLFTKTLMFTHKSFPSLIVAHNEIRNRDNSKKFSDFKTSLYRNLNYINGKVSAELVADFNKQNNSVAFLMDGRHKSNKYTLRYSFWKYGEAFVDLSGGSKTSLISEKVYIDSDAVDYEMSSKRSNQTGGLVKSQLALTSNWKIDFASLYAYKNSDTTELQLYSKLSSKIQSNAKLSVDLLFSQKIRNYKNDSSIYLSTQEKIQARLMLVYNYQKVYSKHYILFRKKTDAPTYAGFFSELKFRSDDYGLIHLWLNFSRLNYNTNQLDYFYGFIRDEINVFKTLLVSFKLSHRYSRLTSVRYQNQFSVDMRWQI